MKDLLSIVIPIFNEEENIEKLLSDIKEKVKTRKEILLVYDSSDDPTVKVANSAIKKNLDKNIFLIKNLVDTKQGVINAIKTGFLKSKGDGVLVLMGDLSDDLSIVDKMFEKIKDGYDIACGSRYMPGGKKIGGPLIKSFLSELAGRSLSFLFRIPTRDATNSFKMYKKSVLKDLKIESTGGFEFSLELIIKAFRKKYRITEIPSIWTDRTNGKSNFKFFNWLPKYIKTYFYAFSIYWDKLSFFKKYKFLLLYLFLIFFEINKLGFQIKDKILITSSLDFSWNTDMIQRFLFGYVAGRDFIFTYGPLFQFLYSIPSVIFKIPSYTSFALSPLISITISFVLLYFIAKMISEIKLDHFFLLIYLLFFVGLVAYPANDLVRIIILFFFSLLIYNLRNNKTLVVVFLGALPSVFGLYSYDLFLQCSAIGIIILFASGIKTKKNLFRLLYLIASIAFFQLLFSFLLTGGLDYIRYSFDTVANYSNNLSTFWQISRGDLVLIFPFILFFIFLALPFEKVTDRDVKKKFYVLILVSFISLSGLIARSDSSHIVKSAYPSIITVFIYFYFLFRKNHKLIVLPIILFLFLPFKVNYDLSPSGIKVVLDTIENKKTFNDIYKFDDSYYLKNADIEKLSNFIKTNKNNVFVYPYDNYLLDINSSTFNSFPLLFYQYSATSTEARAVSEMENNPPKFIIFGIDRKFAVDLDQMPNLTRNPLFFRWIIDNYFVYKNEGKYLILEFGKTKKEPSQNRECSLFQLEIKNYPSESIFSKIKELVKKPVYYLVGKNNIRIPLSKSVLVYDNFLDTNAVSSLFSNALPNPYSIRTSSKQLWIVKVSPVLKTKSILQLNNSNSSIECLN